MKTLESKIWCVQCSAIEKKECMKSQHIRIPFVQFFTKSMLTVENRLQKLNSTWDQIFARRRQLDDIYNNIAAFLISIQTELHNRIKKNCNEVTQILTYQKQLQDLKNISVNSGRFDDEDLLADVNQLKQIADWLNCWEREADSSSAEKDLQNLLSIEERFVQIKFGCLKNENVQCQQIELLRKLPLSLDASGHPPPVNALVSVLSLLLLMMFENEVDLPSSDDNESQESFFIGNQNDSPIKGPSPEITVNPKSDDEEMETNSSSSSEKSSDFSDLESSSSEDSPENSSDDESPADSASPEISEGGGLHPIKSCSISWAPCYQVETPVHFSPRITVSLINDGNSSAQLPSEIKVKNIFQCQICHRVFDTASSLQQHSIVHSSQKSSPSSPKYGTDYRERRNRPHDDPVTSPIKYKPIKCRKCGKLFRLRVSYRRHLIASHPASKSNTLFGFKESLQVK